MFFLSLFFLSLFQTDTIIVYTKVPLENSMNHGILSLVKNRYNKENNDKIHFVFKDLNHFERAFKLFDEAKGNDSILYMNGVTITEERKKKFDFSIPYFPIRPAAMVTKDMDITEINIFDPKLRIAARSNTSNMKHAERISKRTGQKLIKISSTDSLERYYKNNLIDVYITDAVAAWTEKNLKLVHIYKEIEANGYGMLYPKGSRLKERLDKTLKKVISSPDYYKLIKKLIPKINYRYFERVKY